MMKLESGKGKQGEKRIQKWYINVYSTMYKTNELGQSSHELK